MEYEYTVGILGAGQIVTNMHLPVLCADPTFKVSWISDVDHARAQRVGKNFGVSAPNARLEQLPQTDIVLVAVPYGAREPLYESLRARPNALYVEKPFARSVQEHEDYIKWFAHTKIAIGFQRRALGVVGLLRQLVEINAFGRLVSVKVEHGYIGRLTGSGHGADFKLAGGGLLFDTAIHWIDLALVTTAATTATVSSGRMIREGGFDLHTEAGLSVRTGRNEDITMNVLATGLADTSNRTLFNFESVSVSFSHSDLRVGIEKPGLAGVELRSQLQQYPANALQLCHETWQGLAKSMHTGHANWTSAGTSLLTTHVIEQLYALSS